MSDDDKPLVTETWGRDIEVTEFDPKKFLIDGAAAGNTDWMFSAAELPPIFPFTITIGDTKITLNAGGTWSGDITALHKAMAEMKGQKHDGPLAILLWLLLRQMIRTRDDERFW